MCTAACVCKAAVNSWWLYMGYRDDSIFKVWNGQARNAVLSNFPMPYQTSSFEICDAFFTVCWTDCKAKETISTPAPMRLKQCIPDCNLVGNPHLGQVLFLISPLVLVFYLPPYLWLKNESLYSWTSNGRAINCIFLTLVDKK